MIDPKRGRQHTPHLVFFKNGGAHYPWEWPSIKAANWLSSLLTTLWKRGFSFRIFHFLLLLISLFLIFLVEKKIWIFRQLGVEFFLMVISHWVDGRKKSKRRISSNYFNIVGYFWVILIVSVDLGRLLNMLMHYE